VLEAAGAAGEGYLSAFGFRTAGKNIHGDKLHDRREGRKLKKRKPLPQGGSSPYNAAMCSYCGSAMPRDRKPGFNETCELCGRDLHVCVNCRFLSRGRHWDCSETVDEPVPDKEARNKCDWFETSPGLFVKTEGRGASRSASDKARKDLDALFGS
jgi:hypothetical protein